LKIIFCFATLFYFYLFFNRFTPQELSSQSLVSKIKKYSGSSQPIIKKYYNISSMNLNSLEHFFPDAGPGTIMEKEDFILCYAMYGMPFNGSFVVACPSLSEEETRLSERALSGSQSLFALARGGDGGLEAGGKVFKDDGMVLHKDGDLKKLSTIQDDQMHGQEDFKKVSLIRGDQIHGNEDFKKISLIRGDQIYGHEYLQKLSLIRGDQIIEVDNSSANADPDQICFGLFYISISDIAQSKAFVHCYNRYSLYLPRISIE
jgi:hypothetical protein